LNVLKPLAQRVPSEAPWFGTFPEKRRTVMNRNAVPAAGLAVALVLFCAVLCVGCGDDFTAHASATPTRYVIFVDRSLSPGTGQLALWTRAADVRVFQRLKPGDAITAYEVTDRTADTAPLVDIAIPPADDDGMDKTLRVRKILSNARSEGLQAVKDALSHPVARQTRLLDTIYRIPKDETRKLFVLYLTDGKESSPELDLERTRLTDDNFARLAQSAFTRHRWQPETLRGAAVQFVLDSPGDYKVASVNGHQALERFWRLLFKNLGADLTSFDSRIGD
jgi:hypothetical protein